MNKTISLALVTLGVLVALVVFYVSGGRDGYSSIVHEKTDALGKLKGLDVAAVGRVVVAKGKEPPVELEKAAADWVVASAFRHAADKEKVDKFFESLTKLTTSSFEVAGKYAGSHADFEVDKIKGGFITLFKTTGEELARIVVGKNVPSADFKTTRIFVRFGDDAVTYKVATNLRSDASLWGKLERASYLNKTPIKLEDSDECFSLRLVRPNQPDLLLERLYKEVPVVKADDEKGSSAAAIGPEAPASVDGAASLPAGEAKPGEKAAPAKPETKKEEYFVVTRESERLEVGESEKWAARGVVDRLKSLRIDDVSEPKEPKEYGLDAPQLKAVVQYRKKDKPESEVKSVTVSFGNVIKDDKGEDKSYHVLFDAAGLQGRFFTVDKWTFTSWNKELKEFQPKPPEKKDESKVGASGTDAAAGPAADSGKDATPAVPGAEGDAPGAPSSVTVPVSPSPAPAPEQPKSLAPPAAQPQPQPTIPPN